MSATAVAIGLGLSAFIYAYLSATVETQYVEQGEVVIKHSEFKWLFTFLSLVSVTATVFSVAQIIQGNTEAVTSFMLDGMLYGTIVVILTVLGFWLVKYIAETLRKPTAYGQQ